MRITEFHKQIASLVIAVAMFAGAFFSVPGCETTPQTPEQQMEQLQVYIDQNRLLKEEVENLQNAVSTAKEQLAQAREQIKGLEEGTEEYNRWLKIISGIEDKVVKAEDLMTGFETALTKNEESLKAIRDRAESGEVGSVEAEAIGSTFKQGATVLPPPFNVIAGLVGTGLITYSTRKAIRSRKVNEAIVASVDELLSIPEVVPDREQAKAILEAVQTKVDPKTPKEVKKIKIDG